VSNGLPLTKIYHAAFDAHLIGIDPDDRIHLSDRLLEIHNGPFLELGLKGIVGQVIQLPRRSEDRPDRDRLALRFEHFKNYATPRVVRLEESARCRGCSGRSPAGAARARGSIP
jgi:putative restriction endonuclease